MVCAMSDMSRATSRHGLDWAECAQLARLLLWLSEEMARTPPQRVPAAATWPGRAATVLAAEADRLRSLDEAMVRGEGGR